MKFRVAEIFGPTIQGEGKRAGIPCYFIRFGGCDYRCSWCDSPHAVLPDKVAQLDQMTEVEIFKKVRELPMGPRWVVLSGGNPALFDLKLLVAYLQEKYSVMVETQGTVFREWLLSVDELCVSPKGPSSGNITDMETLQSFMRQLYGRGLVLAQSYLKVVVFNDADYEYARQVRSHFPNHLMFLSVGTVAAGQPTVGKPNVHSWGRRGMRQAVSDDFMALAEKLSTDMDMWNVRVLPQLHVIAWGAERGH